MKRRRAADVPPDATAKQAMTDARAGQDQSATNGGVGQSNGAPDSAAGTAQSGTQLGTKPGNGSIKPPPAPTAPGDNAGYQARIAKSIVSMLAIIGAASLQPGEVRINYVPANMIEGESVLNLVYGKDLDGTVYGALVTMKIEPSEGGQIVISATESSVVVSDAGKVVGDGSKMLRYKHMPISALTPGN